MRKAFIAVLAVAMILLASCDPAPKASNDEAVTEIVATPVQGESTITITWKAPAAGSLESYNIYIDNAEEPVATVEGSAISYTYDASSLTSGKHTITIITVDIDGNEAVGATAEFTYNAPAETVTGLTAVQDTIDFAEVGLESADIHTKAKNRITLTWTAPAKAEGLQGFEIRLNGSDPVSLKADKTSYEYSMSDSETGEYTFSVTALYGESVRSVAEVKVSYDATAPEVIAKDALTAIYKSNEYCLGIAPDAALANDIAYVCFSFTRNDEKQNMSMTKEKITGASLAIGVGNIEVYTADKYGNTSEALVVTAEDLAEMVAAAPEA